LPTHLPTQKKTVDSNVFIDVLKKKFLVYLPKIWIPNYKNNPEPKLGSGFSHNVCISAAMSEDKQIIQFIIIVYMY